MGQLRDKCSVHLLTRERGKQAKKGRINFPD
jgi:hypothetical protein